MAYFVSVVFNRIFFFFRFVFTVKENFRLFFRVDMELTCGLVCFIRWGVAVHPVYPWNLPFVSNIPTCRHLRRTLSRCLL